MQVLGIWIAPSSFLWEIDFFFFASLNQEDSSGGGMRILIEILLKQFGNVFLVFCFVLLSFLVLDLTSEDNFKCLTC